MWRLHSPWFLLLALLPLGLYLWRWYGARRGRSSVLFSGGPLLAGLPASWRAKLSPRLHYLRYPGLLLLVLALARPQAGSEVRDIQTFGVDIMLVLDVSGTMAHRDMAIDYELIDRLAAAKSVMKDFVNGRNSDRIGLIAFGTYPLTRCPLTTDYNLLQGAIEQVNLDLFPEEDRQTAIGNAIATAVSRIYKSDARSKIIILLTDGANTAGNIAPLTAADLAADEDVKVYTIGLGTPGRTDVDEDSLRAIAEATGARFFRSTTLEKLKDVYDQIDQLEKSEVVVKNFVTWREQFPWFLWSGFFLLVLEIVMSQIICRRIP